MTIRLPDVLQVLADLSSDSTSSAPATSISLDAFKWVKASSVQHFVLQGPESVSDQGFGTALDRGFAETLARYAQVRGGEVLRLGWLFVAGSTVGEDGKRRPVFFPLVSMPVKLSRPPVLAASFRGTGDVEMTDRIVDSSLRHKLESRVEYGGGGLAGTGEVVAPALIAKLPKLRAFAIEAAAAAGFTISTLVPAEVAPEQFIRRDELVIVVGAAIYVDAVTDADTSRSGSLRRWSEARFSTSTAMHSIYLGDGRAAKKDNRPLVSSVRLNPTQRSALAASRTEPVTVILGAPGTGKSQTLVAIALDAVERSENVLVVAKSSATVDALAELLAQAPGPEPVVFGSSERREALAQRLGRGAGAFRPVPDAEVYAADQEFALQLERVDDLKQRISRDLRAEQRIRSGDSLYLRDDDLTAAANRRKRIASTVSEVATGSRFGRWRAARKLRRLVGGASVEESVRNAREEMQIFDARRLVAEGGLALESSWQQLLKAERHLREVYGKRLALMSRSESRFDLQAWAAVGALATALRSGRAARREQLRKLDHVGATRAYPLWIGTLADVEDLLPPQAGFFDLVILDEAASIDQPLAAPALLRGRRAVVAGDPRQLRQVSFLSDKEIDRATRAYGVDQDPVLAARLDVRRNSILDVATSAGRPIVLDEHFRSSPHLIEFVAKRLYDGAVKVATRRPSNEGRDCIEVMRVSGSRAAGVVREEVNAVLHEIRRAQKGGLSVGVISPFRAQADALEAAVLKAFGADELEAMQLRIGTVHGFQGIERDIVIVSMGIGEGGSWSFVEDPSLAAVLLTRGRERLVVVMAGAPPERGLFADFLEQIDQPPGRVAEAGVSSDWANSVAAQLRSGGVAVATRYPTGRHVVDIVMDDPTRDIAIECDIHSGGTESHIRRRLEMMDRGWEFREAFQSRWEGRIGELAVELRNPPKRPA